MDSASILDTLIEEQSREDDLAWAMAEIDRLQNENARLKSMLTDTTGAVLQLKRQVAGLQWRQDEEDKFQDYLTEGVR